MITSRVSTILLLLACRLASGDGLSPLQHQYHQQPEDTTAAWNFTQWWHERAQPPPQLLNHQIVFDDPANIDPSKIYASDLDTFDQVYVGQKPYLNFTDLVITSSPVNIDGLYTPHTTIKRLNHTIREYFSKPRNWNEDKTYMRGLREDLKDLFLSYGLKTAFHIFKSEDSLRNPLYPGATKRSTACNIIAVLPGLKRNTEEDEIILVGAHYDTVKKSPGVDDNGSGATAVLEIARLLSSHRCLLNKTVIFVLFDLEEEYLKGSKYFVQQYLIPTEINKNRARFAGAYIMDMLLAYNSTNNSQSVRDFWSILPMFDDEVKSNSLRGDFLAVWSRRNIDQDLFFFLEKNWKSPRYPLRLMDPPLPPFSDEINKHWTKYSRYGAFTRSDHASFWYPVDKEHTFNAVLLSDLGPWRRDMMEHYHRPTDDHRLLTQENLEFMKNTVDSLVAAVLDLGEGKCYPVKSSP